MRTFEPRKPTRLRCYDYSCLGCYFVTICTQNQEQIFGVIKNNQMILNECGWIVDYWWTEISNHFNIVKIDKYIIMPNHLHGIINIVGARLPRPKQKGRGDRAPTLGNIMAYFKYCSTKNINDLEGMPGRKIWQRNFHDHIIRNHKPLKAIRQYIVNNPKNWETDENNINNLKLCRGGVTPP